MIKTSLFFCSELKRANFFCRQAQVPRRKRRENDHFPLPSEHGRTLRLCRRRGQSRLRPLGQWEADVAARGRPHHRAQEVFRKSFAEILISHFCRFKLIFQNEFAIAVITESHLTKEEEQDVRK